MSEIASEKEQLRQRLLAALLRQRRAVRACEVVAAAAPRAADRELIAAIRREERRHYYLLEGIYEEWDGVPPEYRRPALSLPKQYRLMLQQVICHKLDAVEELEQLQEQLPCARQREWLALVVEEQKEHARIWAGLYDRT